MKRTSFLGVVLEGLVALHRIIQLQLLQHYRSGHRLRRPSDSPYTSTFRQQHEPVHSSPAVQSLSHVQVFCNPMDCSPAGSSVHWISQAKILTAPIGIKSLGQSRNDDQLWMCLVVKVKSDSVKNKYCIRTWNVRSTNQGKLDMVKQEMEKLNIDILGIGELKWMGAGEFNSDDHYIYYYGQESLRRNGIVLIVNKRS